MKLINVDKGEVYGVLTGMKGSVCSLDFSPANPHWLLCGGEEPTVYLWHVPPPSTQGKFEPWYASVLVPLLWADLIHSSCLARFEGDTKIITHLAFCPTDGFQFLAGGKKSRTEKEKQAASHKRGIVMKWEISPDIEEMVHSSWPHAD